jgi:hypothetical protein
MADAVAETLTKTHGAGCVSSLRLAQDSSSSGSVAASAEGSLVVAAACPCLVDRSSGKFLRNHGSSARRDSLSADEPRPVFYLKLHKVLLDLRYRSKLS